MLFFLLYKYFHNIKIEKLRRYTLEKIKETDVICKIKKYLNNCLKALKKIFKPLISSFRFKTKTFKTKTVKRKNFFLHFSHTKINSSDSNIESYCSLMYERIIKK